MEAKAKLPSSALKLYVKLYCKRKGKTSTKFHNQTSEAIKSWLLLSKDEKEHFDLILKGCRDTYRRRFADYLKNTEPYLKRKQRKRIEETHNQTENNQSLHNQSKIEIIGSDREQTECLELDNSMQNELGVPQVHLSPEPLLEPTPPNVKTGKELFELVNATNEVGKSWQSLSSIEKRRYQNAILSLKKHYISKYKTYLENLPSKELFDYYNKKI